MVFIRKSSLKKHAALRRDKLIHIDDIKEKLYPLKESNVDYITMSGNVYKYYYDNLYFKRKTFINKNNGYVYVSITLKNGKNAGRRLHVLLAKTFLFNSNSKSFKIVGHKDNDKTNNNLSNLYWTNTQENTQKAFDDGLIIQKKSEENQSSIYLKAIDKDTNKIVGVYGSLRECARCIDNITLSSISKVYKKENYKPRNRKYIYALSSKEEYDVHPELQSKHLIENKGETKSPIIFRMTNSKLNYSNILDNQKTASTICNIPQSTISSILKGNSPNPYNGWYFENLGKINNRKESTAYQNHLATVDSYTIKNINDGRILEFNSGKELIDYLGIKGHDTVQYIKKDQILMNEWKIIKKQLKESTEKLKIS